MEKGKWIFLVGKLPAVVSPPAMSIHYAIPWPMEDGRMKEIVGKQLKKLRSLLEKCEYVGKNELEKTPDYRLSKFLLDNNVYDFIEKWDSSLLDLDVDSLGFNKMSEYKRIKSAMMIQFAGEQIRVFPEEFTDVTVEGMKRYNEIFTFHPTDLWNGLGIKPTDPDEKFIFEAALLDGCTPYQANNIVSGGSIESVDDFPPPLGWYECPMELGFYFGKTEEDMKPRYKETA